MTVTDGSVAGTVNVFDVSLDSTSDLNDLQLSDFVLFRLVFQGSAAGTSAIGISLNSLADAAGNNLSASVVGGSASVLQVVPVPGAVWLCGSALGVMGVVRRKISS